MVLIKNLSIINPLLYKYYNECDSKLPYHKEIHQKLVERFYTKLNNGVIHFPWTEYTNPIFIHYGYKWQSLPESHIEAQKQETPWYKWKFNSKQMIEAFTEAVNQYEEDYILERLIKAVMDQCFDQGFDKYKMTDKEIKKSMEFYTEEYLTKKALENNKYMESFRNPTVQEVLDKYYEDKKEWEEEVGFHEDSD